MALRSGLKEVMLRQSRAVVARGAPMWVVHVTQCRYGSRTLKRYELNLQMQCLYQQCEAQTIQFRQHRTFIGMVSMSAMTSSIARADANAYKVHPSPLPYRSTRLPAPFINRAHQQVGRTRKERVIKAGLLDLLNPQAGAKTDARAEELVDSLLDLARRTNGGAKAQPRVREELEELVCS